MTSSSTSSMPVRGVTSPNALWTWGRLLLVAGLGFGLLLVTLVTWKAPDLAPFLPIVLAGLGVAAYLFTRDELNLYVTLAAFVLIAGQEEGLQPEELLYGLYFLAFLGFWYVSRLFFYRDRIAENAQDWSLLLFLCYALASVSWAILFGARPGAIVGEVLMLLMLAFYFPIREACARSPRATTIMLGLIGWFALFASVRNLLIYRAGLSSATQAWQIIMGRVALNEVLLMMPALGVLVLLLYAQRWRTRAVLLTGFLMLFAGLILTQSRGYWASFLVGTLALFFLMDRRRKLRIFVFVAGGLAGTFLLGSLLLDDFIPLILSGVIERFTSLATALTSDVSFVNRLYESAAVWEHIRVNPILGYGIGTPYKYFFIVSDFTKDWAYVHNGYVSLWYKFGLIGLGLMLFFWFSVVRNGIRLFHWRGAPRTLRLAGLIAAVCLIAEALVANTSNPFMLSDALLLFAMFGGVTSGSLRYLAAKHESGSEPAADDDL